MVVKMPVMKEPCDSAELKRQLVEEFLSLIGKKNNRLRLDCANHLKTFETDITKLRQVS